MIRNLKVLGLALVALLAMTAMASSASAATFTSAQSSTTIHATQGEAHKLTVTNQSITCSTVTFHGVISGTSTTTATVNPTYTNCKTAIGTTATVTGFGHFGEEKTCDYLLNAGGTVDLVCQSGAAVKIDAGTCTIHIPGQTGIGTIEYANVANGDIQATLKINNISGTHTDGFACPFESGGAFTNGSMSGTSVVAGSDPETGTAVNITYDK